MRDLVDDRGEQRPAHVGGRLQLRVGARTGRAEKIAAVGRLQIEADRLVLGPLAGGLDALEIALRIDRRVGCDAVHGGPQIAARCGKPVSASEARALLRRPNTPSGHSSFSSVAVYRAACGGSVAPARPTSKISACSRRKLATSSTSYHSGRTCSASPISS